MNKSVKKTTTADSINTRTFVRHSGIVLLRGWHASDIQQKRDKNFIYRMLYKDIYWYFGVYDCCV